MADLLTFTGVTRRMGTRLVLDVPRLSLGPGLVHLAGPVGAGKTTLLRCAATLLRPTTGQIHIAGADTRDGAAARALLGYSGEEPALAPELTVGETLRLHARVHGLRRSAPAEALAALGASHLERRFARACSRGERALADLARASMHEPRVWLLDEPLAHLDEAARARVMTRLDAACAGGALVLVTSHRPLERPAQRTLALRDGRVEDRP